MNYKVDYYIMGEKIKTVECTKVEACDEFYNHYDHTDQYCEVTTPKGKTLKVGEALKHFGKRKVRPNVTERFN